MKNKDKTISLRLSNKMYTIIESNSNKLNMSNSNYLRLLISNGMPLRDVDRVIYPVCTLCRDHEKSGFVHGVQVGARLMQELKETG